MPDATTIAKYWAQRWESGAHKPSDRYRPHLCALLGLPIGTFAEVDNSAQPARYPLTVGQRSVEGDAHTPTGEELIVMAARESAEYSRRHVGSNVHTITLDQLESDAVEMATEFVKASPVPVVLRTRALRDQTFDLLDGRQQPRQTQMLYSVAGRLCGLLAVAASDFFGRYDAAATQCRTAWLCAEMAEDDELRSWVRALQSGVAMWAGRWQEASLLAQRAREHATTRVAAARAAALQARALGRLNDASGVDRAVAVSDAAGNLPASHQAAGVMGFSEANRLRCAGTAYLWLGDIAKADRLLRDALAAYERDAPEAYVFVAVTCADLARIRLTAGDPEGASEALRPVFRLAPDRRLVGVARRMSDLRARLTDARFGGSATAANLAAQIEQFSTDLVALAGGQS